MKKLIPPFLFLICLAAMSALHRWLPLARVFPVPWNRLGFFPILGGLTLGLWGLAWFIRSHADPHPFREPELLVTDGPFRYSRNPMYLGLAMILAGTAVLWGSVSPFIVVGAFMVIADRWYIHPEERVIRRKFGPSAESYFSHTRRWL